MERNNVVLIELSGLPCSGKTTYAMQMVLTHMNCFRVSKEDLQSMIKGRAYTRRDEALILGCEVACVNHIIGKSKSSVVVIIDDPNLEGVDFWRNFARMYTIHYVHKFFPVELDVAINRDAMRADKPSVGREKIREMHKILHYKK